MKKNNNFTLLHYLCAILVIYGHEFAIVGQTGFNPMLFGNKISANSFGVCALFAISGYLVVDSYFRSSSILNYICKRIKRLFPPLFIALVVTTTFILFYYQSFSYNDILSARHYIVQNLFLHCVNNFADVFYDNQFQYSVNVSLWSLLSEFICYILLIPLCIIYSLAKKFCKKKIIYSTFWVLEILTVLYCFREAIDYGLDKQWYFLHVDLEVMICFFVGSTIKIMNLERYMTVKIVGIICLLGVCLGEIIPYVIVFDIVICIAIIAFGNAASICKMPKKNIYYEMYLYAWPIQQIIYNIVYVRLGINIHVLCMFILSLMLTIFIAKISNVLLNNIWGKIDIVYTKSKLLLENIKNKQ